jgi:hypothetical protein
MVVPLPHRMVPPRPLAQGHLRGAATVVRDGGSGVASGRRMVILVGTAE